MNASFKRLEEFQKLQNKWVDRLTMPSKQIGLSRIEIPQPLGPYDFSAVQSYFKSCSAIASPLSPDIVASLQSPQIQHYLSIVNSAEFNLSGLRRILEPLNFVKQLTTIVPFFKPTDEVMESFSELSYEINSSDDPDLFVQETFQVSGESAEAIRAVIDIVGEQKAKISELENKIEHQQSEVEQLNKKIEQLEANKPAKTEFLFKQTRLLIDYFTVLFTVATFVFPDNQCTTFISNVLNVIEALLAFYDKLSK